MKTHIISSIIQPLALYESLFPLLKVPCSMNEQQNSQSLPYQNLYDIIESLPQNNKLQQLTKANYFCMITFPNTSQLRHIHKVLQSCLFQYQLQYGSQSLSFTYKQNRFILLMIRFNLITCNLKLHPNQTLQNKKAQLNSSDKFTKQLSQKLNQILIEHIGEFHILRKLPERTTKHDLILKNYELILFHTFILLQQIAISQNDQEKVDLYKRAFERIQRKSIKLFQQQDKENSLHQNCQIHQQPSKQENKESAKKKNTEATYLSKVIQKYGKCSEQNKKKDFKLTWAKGSVRNPQKRLSSDQNKISNKENLLF